MYRLNAEACVRHGGAKENSDSEFLAGIPDKWTEEAVQDFVFWPMKKNSPYPAWEVPARAYGSPTIYAWWRGDPDPG